MTALFQVRGGSVTGRDHRKGVPRNRQDDFHIAQFGSLTTAIVCDGCGSGTRSEVGASLAVRLLTQSLHRHLPQFRQCDEQILRKVRLDLTSQLHMLASGLGPSYAEVVTNYFLFTILGVVISEAQTMFFGLGDGLFAVNGQVTIREPAEGNQPVYLGYALTGSELTDHDPSLLDFQVLHTLPTAELEHFLIGTDGVRDIMLRNSETIPGSDEAIGPLEQFWTEERYFHNPAAIERRLNLMARDWQHRLSDGRQVMEGGKLPDDTTVIVGRRLPYDPRDDSY